MINDIFNFRRINDRLATGGQPVAAQFQSIRDAGCEVIINLALPTSDNALPDEGRIVTALGMSYLHIPVDFKQPTAQDYRAFSRAMDAFSDRPIFVHCAANMRVSAFIFLYRILRHGISPVEAERDLRAIWQPDEVWSRFIEDQLNIVTVSAADPVGAVAQKLIQDLCSEMSARYGSPPSPFSPSEAASPRTVFLIASSRAVPAGCGALRQIDQETAEIKRMYVAPASRRQGIARRILSDLERHATDFGYRAVRLETGVRQPEAQSLYESLGYRRIPSFGPYAANSSSVCFEKILPTPASPANG